MNDASHCSACGGGVPHLHVQDQGPNQIILFGDHQVVQRLNAACESIRALPAVTSEHVGRALQYLRAQQVDYPPRFVVEALRREDARLADLLTDVFNYQRSRFAAQMGMGIEDGEDGGPLAYEATGAVVDAETVETLVGLAREGKEAEFRDMAACVGVPAEEIDGFWTGTVRRVRSDRRC